jgi:hypothetical protein
VLLSDSVLDKTTVGTKSLDVLEKQAELRSEIAQLDVTLSVAEKQLQEDNRQIDRLRDAINIAKQSPYYLNATGNSGSTSPSSLRQSGQRQPGAHLRLLSQHGSLPQGWHREAGISAKQVISHPIFKTQVRGLTILMDLSHPESAKSQTVFLGRKPLLF